MTIQWLGHACFRITAENFAIVIDPYEDGYVPGLVPLDVSANAVLCSHAHGDHGAVHVVQLLDPLAPSPFSVTKIESVHDDQGGALRGPNTIHILQANGIRAAHLGDLGAMPSEGQIAAIGSPDVLMVPIGGHYTIDAAGAKAVCDALQPRVILPMHYRSDRFGFDVLGTLDAFTRLYDHAETLPGDTLEITRDAPSGVILPTYQG